MEPFPINLLPLSRLRLFRREYFLRLGTTGTVLCSLLLLIHGILLVPSYVYLQEQILTREARIKGLDAIRTPEQLALTAQVALFEKNASRLGQLDVTTPGSDVLRLLLQSPHTGVTLSGFTYTPDKGKGSYRLLITGVAGNREALRQYDNTLSSLPFVTNVDLPIAAYAKETQIPFTLTLTGTKP